MKLALASVSYHGVQGKTTQINEGRELRGAPLQAVQCDWEKH